MEKILVLAHLDEAGKRFPNAALEAVSAGMEWAKATASTLTIGIVGGEIQAACGVFASTGARILGVEGAEFAQPRYATDAAAAEALCHTSEASIVIAPATSRFARVMSGVAHRVNGVIDTHITAVSAGESLQVTRWYYRQRVEAVLTRSARPWFLLVDAGTHEAWQGTPGEAKVEMVAVTVPDIRTKVAGIRAPKTDEQTIRPDAKLLFVAGAGWTKKQSDGQVHAADAESLILGFLHASGASLGSSKSLVDQSGENQVVLKFMTHLNQIGQTGSTPRHPRGLSTCCHGEEPHVVGWRFIGERRAINLDPNCGWARGKADVLYVADAFQVMAKVNQLLAERRSTRAASAD